MNSRWLKVVSAGLYVVMLGVGWRYPLLGTLVFGFMGAFVLLGGRRKWCASACPRGSFLDVVWSKLSPRRPAPKWLSSWRAYMVALSAFLVLFGTQLLLAHRAGGLDLKALGFIFWRMCVVSSLVALPLGLWANHRTWCSFCPVGKLLRI
ncbi:MAG: 4Fe-4S binding protein [Thermanaerothrix sp.]|nr:4Fe-4S binding protein [Thermanaerothrix sp.]